MSTSIVFYQAPFSSAMPVAIALAELEVLHESVTFNLAAGEQRTPDFLRLNPNGKVPTLVVDGTPMFEALAILQWLGDRYGSARGVWPRLEDPRRLEALSWTAWAYVTYGGALKRYTVATSDSVPAEVRHPPAARFAREELDRLLAILDARLARQSHILGDGYSLADLAAGSAVGYGKFCGVDTGAYPAVSRWLEAFQARPAVRKVWS